MASKRYKNASEGFVSKRRTGTHLDIIFRLLLDETNAFQHVGNVIYSTFLHTALDQYKGKHASEQIEDLSPARYSERDAIMAVCPSPRGTLRKDFFERSDCNNGYEQLGSVRPRADGVLENVPSQIQENAFAADTTYIGNP